MVGPQRFSSARFSSSAQNAVSLGVLPVNLSGSSQNGAASDFTLGGWVRLVDSQPLSGPAVVFSASGGFQLSIDTNGTLIGQFGGAPPLVGSNVFPVTNDGKWHFLAAAYKQDTPGANSGALSLYVDGDRVAASTVNGSAAASGASLLGPATPLLEFASWAIWSSTLSDDDLAEPLWGTPAAGVPIRQGMVGSWDFANGPAQEQSGSNLPTQVSQQLWLTESLNRSAGSDDIAANNPIFLAPFSAALWAFVPAGTSQPVSLLKYRATAGEGETIGIVVGSQGPGIASGFYFSGRDDEDEKNFARADAPLQLDAWNHIAVVVSESGEGGSTALFLNGALAATAAASVNENDEPITVPLFQFGDRAARIQGLSFWTRALSSAEITQFMNQDVSAEQGCVTYFPLTVDAANGVTGAVGTLAADAGFSEHEQSFTAQELDRPDAELTVEAAVRAATRPQHLLPADFDSIAAIHGLQTRDPDEEYSGYEPNAAFEALLAHLPQDLAVSTRQRFYARSARGQELVKRGITPGVFTSEVHGGDRVFFYHTHRGPAEIDRVPASTMTPEIADTTTIVCDVIGLVMSALGARINLGLLRQAATTALRTTATEATALITTTRAAGSANLNLPQFILRVMGILNNGRTLYTLIRSLLAGIPWYSLIFTILSLIGQIILIFIPGGSAAALAIRLALVADAMIILTRHLVGPPLAVAAVAASQPSR